MPNNVDSALEFVANRPLSIAAYGYGSGIFHQASYSSEDKPQIDIIFVVDDLKNWHQQNMELNPNDYCLTGKLHLSIRSIKKIKGHNNITYFSQIEEGNNQFKYGVIEVTDFEESLSKWENLFVAGRFQKPVYCLHSIPTLEESIAKDRQYALAIACLFSPPYTNADDLLKIICSLSYAGDTRMLFAENPYKVSNIVLGNHERLMEMYIKNSNFMRVSSPNCISIHHYYILKCIDKLLPKSLVDYLAERNTNLNDIIEVRNNINEYIISHNREESYAQTLEGFKTNGIVRSIPYIKAKVKKRFESVDITQKIS